MGKRRNLGQLHPLDDEIRAHLIRRLILKIRVETKIFVFVFSRKFRENLFSLFAKISPRKYENFAKIFAEIFAKFSRKCENENFGPQRTLRRVENYIFCPKKETN